MVVDRPVRPVAAECEQNYPGIKVQGSGLTSSEAALKIMMEARAGNQQADVFDRSALVFRLIAAGVVEPYKPAAQHLPTGCKDEKGLWTALNIWRA